MARTNAEPPAIVGDVYRVSMYSINQSQTCINSWDYMGDTPPSTIGQDMVNFLSAWVLAVKGAYLACVTSQTNVVYALCQCVSSLSPPTVQQTIGIAGSVTGPPLPLEVAAILKKLSALKGQHGRGRCFLPGVPTSFTDPLSNPNRLNVQGSTAYNALAATLLTARPAGGRIYTPVISKRPVGPIHVVTNAVHCTDMQAVALLATQRRRKEGRGI